MKILLLDIETSPNSAHVWGLFNQNIGLPQLLESSYVLCWAAKWLDKDEVIWRRSHGKNGVRRIGMLKEIHKLLEAADVVVHYNGAKFDIPTLHKEFILHGIVRPAPSKQIDLLTVARTQFKFVSNKLDYVAQTLKLGRKTKHQGHEMWIQCMAGDADAWKTMEDYNKQDVVILEKLYHKLLPWMKTHANRTLYGEDLVCPTCGHEDYQRRGYAFSSAGKYARYQCKGCAGWFRGSINERRGEKFTAI